MLILILLLIVLPFWLWFFHGLLNAPRYTEQEMLDKLGSFEEEA
jgi:hypothetical protein